jgi:hypothetical protein
MATLSEAEEYTAAMADQHESLRDLLRELPEQLLTLRGQRCRLVREIDGHREELEEDDVRRMLLERIG